MSTNRHGMCACREKNKRDGQGLNYAFAWSRSAHGMHVKTQILCVPGTDTNGTQFTVPEVLKTPRSGNRNKEKIFLTHLNGCHATHVRPL